MQIVILAAGQGKRLQPLTKSRAKAMAPILDRPMIWRVMETLYNACQAMPDIQLDEIIVVRGADPQLEFYLTAEWKHTPLRFLVQESAQGAAHALTQAAPSIKGDFILSACDNLLPTADVISMLRRHQEPDVVGTLSLMEVPQERIRSTGIIAWEQERITQIIEKPMPEEAPTNIASLPLYIFTPALLQQLGKVAQSSRGEYELQDAIQLLIDQVAGTQHYVTGVMVSERRQLTDMADLLDLNRHFMIEHLPDWHVEPTSVGTDTKIVTPLYIDPDVEIGRNCQIGPNVYLEAGCRVGDDVTIQDAMILRDTVVEPGRQIMNCIEGAEFTNAD